MPRRPLSVCAEPGCPELVDGGRCARHARTSSRNHYGTPRQNRGHGSDYDAIRRTLLGLPCHWCGRPADTADYLVPVSQGGTLADLVPACHACNFARGAAMTRIGGRETFDRVAIKDRMPAVLLVRQVQALGSDHD